MTAPEPQTELEPEWEEPDQWWPRYDPEAEAEPEAEP